ncbi:hypothetical protein L218DRAFT_950868 [Marasmius fiardii PR-910]|nr:hypothetical protein L218DRAFT_950868 [Marasmius fiardii PR-910]
MSRALNFTYEPVELTEDVNVILGFRKPDFDPSYQSVAWRAVTLNSSPNIPSGKFTIYYSGRLGISLAQITQGDIVMPKVIIEMLPGQSTTLRPDGTWSQPTSIGGNVIGAVNGTDSHQDIAFGTVEENQGFLDLSPIFCSNVAAQSALRTDFLPILQICLGTFKCQETEGGLITGDMESKLIWSMNLVDLAENSNWAFKEDFTYKRCVTLSVTTPFWNQGIVHGLGIFWQSFNFLWEVGVQPFLEQWK